MRTISIQKGTERNRKDDPSKLSKDDAAGDLLEHDISLGKHTPWWWVQKGKRRLRLVYFSLVKYTIPSGVDCKPQHNLPVLTMQPSVFNLRADR